MLLVKQKDGLTPPHADPGLRNSEEIQINEIANRDQETESDQGCDGAWFTTYNTHTGRAQHVRSYCDDWRNCPCCFKRRKEKYQGRIKTAIRRGNVCYLPPGDERIPKVKEGLSKDDYLRLPIESGGFGFFYEATGRDKIGRQILSIYDLSDALWNTLVFTPEGERPSGNLGRSEPTDAQKHKNANWDKVNCKTVMTPSDPSIADRRAEAERAAETKTSDLDPHTLKEVRDAVSRRVEVLIQELKDRGVPILGCVWVSRWVHIPTVNWHPHTAK
jgi:hypothetical protein